MTFGNIFHDAAFRLYSQIIGDTNPDKRLAELRKRGDIERCVDEAIAKDAAGRVAQLKEEIGWIESRRVPMLNFWSLVENGTIPTRVTHNDTKISNILFDADNGQVLCAIDLDTVMSSTSLNDFGDAIRSYTNTGAEDDKQIENVSMSIDMFRAYTEGFLSERKQSMTDSEVEWLAFSGIYITYEQVLRFLNFLKMHP